MIFTGLVQVVVDILMDHSLFIYPAEAFMYVFVTNVNYLVLHYG